MPDSLGQCALARNVESAPETGSCGHARATDARPPSQPGLCVVRRIDDLEREAIAQALADTCGNKKEAARRLGISRRALDRRIEKFGLDAIARAA